LFKLKSLAMKKDQPEENYLRRSRFKSALDIRDIMMNSSQNFEHIAEELPFEFEKTYANVGENEA